MKLSKTSLDAHLLTCMQYSGHGRPGLGDASILVALTVFFKLQPIRLRIPCDRKQTAQARCIIADAVSDGWKVLGLVPFQ